MGFECTFSRGFTISLCLRSCTSPSDCPLSAGLPDNDADNYACEDSVCIYLGCNDDDECEMARAGYVCRAWPSLGPIAASRTGRVCTASCTTPDDCDSMLAPGGAFDADNYDCVGGACIYAGCNTDEECAITTGTRPSACR
jgi:hypothetical protein